MAEARCPRKIVPGWDEQIQANQKKRAFKEKTFEQLSSGEKDELLKAIALRLGLIASSEKKA